MKILYDHQMFLVQKYGGISKYFCELIKNLPPEYEFKLSVILSDNQHLKDDYNFFKKAHLPIPKNNFKGKGFLRRKLYNLNKAYSISTIGLSQYDLFHPTYYDPYFLNHLKKPYIVTVHDLIEFKFKELFVRSRIPEMEKIIKNANRIISISENTKKDIIEILGINPEKIDVIYHGFNQPTVKPNKNFFGPYVLFIGYREGYKNFLTLAKAFSLLIVKHPDLRLICVGQPFLKEEINELKVLKIEDKTIAIGVNESKLNELYSNALVFVYPTLYEGFGMPILEAFANNCPVCLSNTSSLPEIAGDAGVYFDPYDENSILIAIRKVIYDKKFSNEIIEAGRKRLLDFSWKKCALETEKSYEKALNN